MAKIPNSNQIIRKDGRNCFVEALRSSYGIGKILLKFSTYDLSRQQGDKITNQIDIYMDFAKFNRIAADYLDNGEILNMLNADRQRMDEISRSGQSAYPQYFTLHQGGTSANKLAAQGKARPDGKSEARMLKIFAGSKLPIMFQAELGMGETQGTGIIVPRYGNKPEKLVRIGMTYEDAKEFFLAVRNDINGYIASERVSDSVKIRNLENQIEMLTDIVCVMANNMNINCQAIIDNFNSRKEQEKQNRYNQNPNNGNRQ